EIGFVPPDHATEGRVDVGDAALHIEYPHAGGHRVFHGATKTRFGNKGGFCAGTNARVAPQKQQADDNHAGEGSHHHEQALLAGFLIDSDKHDTIVVYALKPREHTHDAEEQNENDHGREPIEAAPVVFSLFVKACLDEGFLALNSHASYGLIQWGILDCCCNKCAYEFR